MSVLSLAVILAFASDPACGAAAPGSEFAQHLAAIAIHESAGGDPYVIGVNADPAHRLPAAMVRSATAQEASTKARDLIARGRSIDLGLMGINSLNLARHGLTAETAFDPCRSMKAGADHYAADVRAVWDLAHRRYNTGGTERGAAYTASVEAVLARVRTAEAAPAAPAAPVIPLQPAPPPCAPAWDGWALAKCSARQRAPTPAVEPSSAAMLTATIGPNPNANPEH